MTGRLAQSARRIVHPGWGLAAVLLAGTASGQTMLGADPYRPYNSGYESYSLPPSPMLNYSAINQLRTPSYSQRANQMSQFYDELYGVPGGGPGETTPPRMVGPGVPYTRANRQYDEQFGRVYTPNSKDAEFYQDQRQRSQAYFDALREKDPKKRAARLRAVEEANLQAARALGVRPHLPASRLNRSGAPRATAPRAGAGGTPGQPRTSQSVRSPAGLTQPPAGRAPAALSPSVPSPRTPLTEPNPRYAPVPGAGLMPARPGISARRATTRPRAETPSQTLDRALRDRTEPSIPEPLPPAPRGSVPPSR